MVYCFLASLSSGSGVFNVFRYISFRTVGAILTALFIGLFLGKPFIKWLKLKQGAGQPIRADGPASHLATKQGTPTMGGILLLISLTISTLIWANIQNYYIWVVLLVTIGFGGLGACDDYLKLTKRSSDGLSGRSKLLGQAVIALAASLIMTKLNQGGNATVLSFPFLKEVSVDLGVFFYLFAIFVIVGASNAVNLTDGLDGLAIVPVMIATFCFAIISYVVGNSVFSVYLQVPHVPNVGEVAIFCGALIGAGLAFLWFNAPPARVFMGDTGSLAAGGALGVVSIMTKHEIVLGIIGGLFVIEALSVILQVGYYKMTGKRIFLMAPIHHHFEKKGWAESTIVIRFWIIATVLGLIGLSTLKLR